MAVIKEMKSGLFTCAVVYTQSQSQELSPSSGRVRRKLEAAALRFAIARLVASGESLGDACLLLEQMAEDLETM